MYNALGYYYPERSVSKICEILIFINKMCSDEFYSMYEDTESLNYLKAWFIDPSRREEPLSQLVKNLDLGFCHETSRVSCRHVSPWSRCNG